MRTFSTQALFKLKSPFRLALTILNLFLSSAISPAFGGSSSDSHGEPRLYLGGGVIYQNASRTAIDSTGGTSNTSNPYSTLALAGHFRVGSSWGLSPVFTFTPLGASGADPGEKTMLFTGDLRIFYNLFSFLELHMGPGVLFDRMSGSGGTETLNNGSSTLEFGLPSGSFIAWIDGDSSRCDHNLHRPGKNAKAGLSKYFIRFLLFVSKTWPISSPPQGRIFANTAAVLVAPHCRLIGKDGVIFMKRDFFQSGSLANRCP
jgi:hypothetical protein